MNLTLLEIAQGCAQREKLADAEIVEILDGVSGMSCRGAKRELASRYPCALAELPPDQIRELTAEQARRARKSGEEGKRD